MFLGKISLAFLLLLSTISAHADNVKPDSLLSIVLNVKEHSQKIEALIELSDYYIQVNPDSALLFILQAVKLSEKEKQADLYVKSMFQLELVYEIIGEYGKALDCCYKVIEKAKVMHNDLYLGKAYNYIGIIKKSQDEFDEAIKYFQNSLKLFHKLNKTDELVKVSNNMAVVYRIKGQYSKALNYLRISEEGIIKIGDSHTLAIVYSNIGNVYTLQMAYDSAIFYYQKSKLYFEKINDKRAIGDVYLNLGNIEYNKNNLDAAIEYYLKSANLYDELGYQIGLSDTYSNIASILLKLKNYAKAEEYYNMSLAIDKKLNNESGIAKDLKNLGNIYFSKEEYKKALATFLKSLEIQERLQNKPDLAGLYENIGLSYNYLKDDKQSQIYLEKSLALKNEMNDTLSLVNLYCSLANIRFQKFEYKKALEYYSKGYQLGLKTGNRDDAFLYNIWGLAICYANLKDHKKAHDYLDLYQRMNDSILSATTTSQVIEMQTKYETEKKQREIEIQQLVIKQKTTERNTAMAASALVLVLGASLVYFLYYKRKKDKLLFEKDRTIKDQEIRSLIKENEEKSVQSLIEGQELEKKRVSGELHDKIGGMLSLLKLQFAAIENHITDQGQNGYKSGVAMLDQVYQEVRTLSHELASNMLSRYGLVRALSDIKATIEQMNVVDFHLQVYGNEEKLSYDTELNLFRILQELISNTLKYSQAKNIHIQLNYIDGEILDLTFEDDGQGFDLDSALQKGNGIGLQNIRQRAIHIKAEIDISTAPGQGTCVIISGIPIKDVSFVKA